MNAAINRRTVHIAKFIIATGATVRTAGKEFGLSKTSIHKDMTTRLRLLDDRLYKKVRKVFDKNKRLWHLRGGAVTKAKFKEMCENALS